MNRINVSRVSPGGHAIHSVPAGVEGAYWMPAFASALPPLQIVVSRTMLSGNELKIGRA
jgi:hypothetical protein